MMNSFLNQRIGLLTSSRTCQIEALLSKYFPSCPVQRVENVEDLLTIDALLAGGGPDLDPAMYGEPLTHSRSVQSQRDQQERAILRHALDRGISFLGLCRGAQLLNVAQGGTLYQDLAIERGCGHSPAHVLEIEPAVQEYFSPNPIVNSSHHQGVRQLGRQLTVIAHAHDGLPEAWWMPGAIGVQFHPETLIQDDPAWQRLFRWWLSGAQLPREPQEVPTVMTDIDSQLLTTLTSLGFSAPVSTRGRLSVADLFPRTKRRGLYVLHAGDEHYLGRTENVARRYREHLEHHPDTEAISFRPMPKGDLHSPEQEGIRLLERQGIRLRNSAGMSLPLTAGSDLDELVPLTEQQAWLAGDEMTWTGRSRDAAVRQRHERVWQTFQKRPGAAALQSVLEQYVRTCILAPGRTEMSLWSVTCFAKGGFRLNAGWQEVFRTLDGREFFLLVAPSVLAETCGPDWARDLASAGVYVERELYSFPGHDHVALFVYGVDRAQALLDRPGVVAAARALSWRCMRKAPNPNSRSHAPQLVDFLDDQARQ